MFKNLDTKRRIEQAKSKMEKVLGHLLYVLELHANNKLVVCSPILSSQIPASYAANAFNIFQRSMHQIEIVRLCALWDGVDPAKENIPTVVALINKPGIIELLAEETGQHWANQSIRLLKRSDEPQPTAAEIAAIKQAEVQFGDEQASKARTALNEAIVETKAIQSSARLASVMNLRDKQLAHSLSETRREKRTSVAPMKYGDETKLIDISCSIVERLYCWVNGKSFSLDDSRRIDDENAEALWKGCRISVCG
jgi:hypothetical protein